MKAVVWEGRFDRRAAVPALERLNSSIADDAFLFAAEIRASAAYAEGLRSAGVLTPDECASILAGLDAVLVRVQEGEDLSPYEDVHTAVELLLIREIGLAGRKLHTGRSRNEQVATDERLYLKWAVPGLRASVAAVQSALLALAESAPEAVLPGYTHLQRGQPVLFAHYILSFFWALERGKARLDDALKRVDVLPLGSGALAGSTSGVDRDELARLLGFAAVSENSLDAVGDRGFILETLAALAFLLLDLSRLAEDFVIFASAEFGFIALGDAAATSSSLMPQKRNPDIFELLRAAPGRLFGHFSRLFLVLKGLPSSYNKDLQEDKAPLREGVADARRALDAAAAVLGHVRVRPERMAAAVDASLYATDLVDELTARGVPFREAHGIVAALAARAERGRTSLDSYSAEEWRAVHPALGQETPAVFNPARSIARKTTTGSTNPEMVRRQVQAARSRLAVS